MCLCACSSGEGRCSDNSQAGCGKNEQGMTSLALCRCQQMLEVHTTSLSGPAPRAPLGSFQDNSSFTLTARE